MNVVACVPETQAVACNSSATYTTCGSAVSACADECLSTRTSCTNYGNLQNSGGCTPVQVKAHTCS